MNKRMRVLLMGMALTGLILGSMSTTAMAAKKIKLCAYAALSGPAAPWGIPQTRAIELEADAINRAGGIVVDGKTYEFEVIKGDHKYVPAESAKLTNKGIYSDRCKFMAIQGGPPALAALPLIKENNVLLMGFAGGGKRLTNPDNPLVFRYNPSIDVMYSSAFPILKKRENARTVVVVNPDDATGESGLEAATRGAKYAGLKVIGHEFFQRGSKDLSSLLTRLIAKKPDILDTSYTDPGTSALIVKQARELGFKGTIFMAWGPHAGLTKMIAGPHAEKAYMVMGGPIRPITLEQKLIYNAYVAKWGKKDWSPVIWSNLGLASTLARGIELAQSFDPQKIAAVMENLVMDVPVGKVWFSGSKFFGIKRQLLYPATLYQFQNMKPVYIGSPPVPKGVMD